MKKIILMVAVAALVMSCSKDDQNSTNDGSGSAKVNFAAGIDIETKAANDLPSGSQVQVWAFLSTQTPGTDDAKVMAKTYSVASAGTLAPIKNAGEDDPTEMSLTYGTYKFLSAGVINYNATTYPLPTFTGKAIESAAGLKNQADYILIGSTEKEIGSAAASKVIALDYKHASSQVQVTVAGGTGVTVNSVKSISITPSNPAAPKLSLLTGITQAATVTTAEAMTKTQDAGAKTFSYIMLPLAASKEVTLEIVATVVINAETKTDMTFVGTVTTPSGGYVGGSLYTYTATLKGNGVTFSSVTVTPWTTVSSGDISGTEKPTV